jgi:crotonobetainyl-CoA:carnitine CoA-transferase CaiB-like acyl-CoA transferase
VGALLEEAGVACAPVQKLSQVLASEQERTLAMVRAISHPIAGETPTVRLPLTLDDEGVASSTPPPLLGADNERGFD